MPEDVARSYNVVPLMIEGDALRVAMDDPQDIDAINTLTTVTGYACRPKAVSKDFLVSTTDRRPTWWSSLSLSWVVPRRVQRRLSHNRLLRLR